MKNILVLLAAFSGLIIGNLNAQSTDLAKEKMKLFAAWEGKWKGEGAMQMGPGEPKKSSVDEKIEYKVDGTVMQMEGLGKTTNASGQDMVVHQALGVLSYDQASSQYKLKTYVKTGHSADAWFTVTGENTYQWGFDVPGRGKTRYTIKIDGAKKTWNEIGEYSADGTAWNKFFEMNLTKVE